MQAINCCFFSFIFNKVILKNKRQKFYYRDIPTNDSPAYVGKTIKGHVDGNDLIATILDLTRKGYIKIEIEQINNKDVRVLYLQKSAQSLELKEYELFIINQIFKKGDRIIFDDYIKSPKFKQDFKTFDKMMDRRSEIKSTYKQSLLKDINKIILLIIFSVFGMTLFYSIMLPITINITNIFINNIKTKVIVNIVISSIIYLLVSYKYISYINKTTN